MIREIRHFFRYGPAIRKRQKELGRAAFLKAMSVELDAEGFAELRTSLVGDLQGEILEIGAGTGATFRYYGPNAQVTAIEPDDELRAMAEVTAKQARAGICVLPGEGERLRFDDSRFDTVVASLVLCSVTSPATTLGEFRRVLRPGGQIRLMEHVRSEHWLAGPLMHVSNPIWLRINGMGCNWNRRTVESVRDAGFKIHSIEPFKIYSKAAAMAAPSRIIKGAVPA